MLEYVIKNTQFKVVLNLTVSAHAMSNLSNVLAECRNSKFYPEDPYTLNTLYLHLVLPGHQKQKKYVSRSSG